MTTPHQNIIRRMASLLVIGALGTVSAYAAPLAYDSFESYTTGSNIHGQTGGTGWSGAWSVLPIGSGTSGVSTVSATEITYNYGGTTLGGGKSLLLGNLSNGTQRNVFSSLNTSGSDFYVSMVFQVSGSVFAGWQAKDGAPDIDNDSIAVVTTPTNGQGSVGARVDGATVSSAAGSITPGPTYFLVMEYTGWTGTSYSTVNIWINPLTGDQSNSTISATYTDSVSGDGQGSAGFLGPYVRTTGIDSVNGEFFLLDDLRVGTDWASVTTIPEPSTASLAFAGVAGLVALLGRRRIRGRSSVGQPVSGT